MLGPRNTIARLQSDFYRDRYRRVLRWLFAAVVIIFMLIAAIFYKILVQPQQNYYGNTTEGKILPMPKH